MNNRYLVANLLSAMSTKVFRTIKCCGEPEKLSSLVSLLDGSLSLWLLNSNEIMRLGYKPVWKPKLTAPGLDRNKKLSWNKKKKRRRSHKGDRQRTLSESRNLLPILWLLTKLWGLAWWEQRGVCVCKLNQQVDYNRQIKRRKRFSLI